MSKPKQLLKKRAACLDYPDKVELNSEVKQVEFRGQDVLIHEPLASRVQEFCRRHKISPRQFFTHENWI